MDAWGKFDESTADFHRLEHHCANVAAGFEALLCEPVLRPRLERASGVVSLCPTTEARLTVIAFLHDFAKLNTGFQFKVPRTAAAPAARRPRSAGHVGEALWAFERESVCDGLGPRHKVDDRVERFATVLLAALRPQDCGGDSPPNG